MQYLYNIIKPETITGMTEDTLILYHYAMNFKFKNILELGVGPYGNSTRTFALASSQIPDSKFISVDIDENCIKEMSKKLQELGLDKYVTFIVDDSINVLRQSPSSFYDCIFMDTSHEYKQTLTELFLAASKINLHNDNACIFLHDTMKMEVWEPINIFLAYSPYWLHIEFNTEGGLGLLMKKSYFQLARMYDESKFYKEKT